MNGRELHWKIDGRDVEVRIEESSGSGMFHAGGQAIRYVLERHPHGGRIAIEGKPHRFYVIRERDSYTVWLDGRTYFLERIEKGRLSQGEARTASGDITALMPGKILRIDVAVDDRVTEKQILAVMESMKMETSLLAPKSGRVVAIHCRAGQVVEMGESLIVIE
jgi:acetyl/propionyl-CoA carboxylase alpha subunit